MDLVESEARFRNMVSITTDGIVIVDSSGMILFVNPAAETLFGRKSERLLHEPFGFPIVAGETTELDLVTGGGTPTIAEMRVVATEWDGNPAYLATLHDISERKRAEKEIERLNSELTARAADLEAANNELEAFNYRVAHDLRQPLNVISSYCQGIQMICGEQLEKECQDFVQQAYNGTLRMNRLIDTLLNFSHVGQMIPRRKAVDLSSLAHEVAEELKLVNPERRVDFRIAEGVVADGDENLLRVVLDNLLGNALKYSAMRDKAVIELGMTDINGDPAYFVRDNGAGFDMADTEKLFNSFLRLKGVEEVRGFGIGLATVKGIIMRHGGRIWAEGEPGKGACFFFTLPKV